MKNSIQSSQIEILIKKGKRIVLDNFMIIYDKKNTESKQNKFSVVVSKKYIKKANKRNKVKRVIRSAVRESNLPFEMFVIMYRSKKILKYKEVLNNLSLIKEKI